MRFFPGLAGRLERARARRALAAWRLAAPDLGGRSATEVERTALRAGQGTWLIARAVSLRGF